MTGGGSYPADHNSRMPLAYAEVLELMYSCLLDILNSTALPPLTLLFNYLMPILVCINMEKQSP